MGFCLSCCKDPEPSYSTPNEEERRQKMIEAAEKRMKEQEGRGVKNVESVKRMQERAKRVDEASSNDSRDGLLRWQVT